MANLLGDMDWCWGSLRPWQLLHSKLAEKERCGSMVDVWELIDQTLGATTDLISRGRDGSYSNYATTENSYYQDRRRSHGGVLLQLLGDDGDYWRHGGVMEARIRECLVRRDEEDINTEHIISTSTDCSDSSTVIGAINHVDDSRRPAVIRTNAAELRQYCTAAVSSWRTEMANSSASAEAQISEEEEEEEENEDGEFEAAEQGHHGSVELDGSFDSLVESESADRSSTDPVLQIHKCCSSGTSTAAVLAVADNSALDLEEAAPLCPVCLEMLLIISDEADNDNDDGVVRLGCRHAFHADCLSPWLQRQPHACCPCCRAPIPYSYYSSLPPPPSLAASPPDLADGTTRHGIMRLLADVEAVLDQLGLRS